MRSRSPHRILGALALVACWLTLPLAGLLHGDDHGHRFCAEHGTIEEGTASGAHGDGSSGPALSSLADAASDSHSECPLATAPSRDALQTTVSQVSVEVQAALSAPLVQLRAAHPPQSPLQVAPKVSPPTA